MDNPLWTVIICLSFVYFAKVLGPRMMKNFPPFQLRGLMMAYNLCQIVFHIWLINEVAQSGFFTQSNYLCQAVDYSQDPSALRLMRSVYVFYLLKYLDMFDTLFFILRKKWDQITFLHVVHHGLVPFLCYPLLRFVPGGNSMIAVFLNSMEHILMYSYYLVAAMGPPFQSFVIKWKKPITIFQIAQFAIVSLHSFRLFFVDCPYPIFFTYWIASSEVLFLCLFINFYRKSYIKKSTKKQT